MRHLSKLFYCFLGRSLKYLTVLTGEDAWSNFDQYQREGSRIG
ncbi:hypothetical protein [Desulfurococcus mucosus]|nr:hypothetical protein [Desulfurococcus mucosus]